MSNAAGNIKIMEDWLMHSVLPILSETGVWAAPNPAPLTEDEVIGVFERVAKSDAYERQHLTSATMDDRVVHLQNGVVHGEPAEGTPWANAEEVFER